MDGFFEKLWNVKRLIIITHAVGGVFHNIF
jgi:hypothetical protein